MLFYFIPHYSFYVNEVDVKNNIYIAAFLFTIYCYIYCFICEKLIVIQLDKSQNAYIISLKPKYMNFVIQDPGIKSDAKQTTHDFYFTFFKYQKAQEAQSGLFLHTLVLEINCFSSD